MFCIKCGKELPDNAVFCSACGYKTNFDKATNHIPTKSSGTNEQLKIALQQENKNTLIKMNEELDKLKDRKSTNWLVFIMIIVLFAFFSICGFVAMDGELTSDTIDSMMLGLFAGAISLGTFFGALINNSKFNAMISKKEDQIKCFKYQNKL